MVFICTASQNFRICLKSNHLVLYNETKTQILSNILKKVKMKITKKELIKTAKELNELMGLYPAIPTAKDTEDSVLMEKIGETAEMLEEDDEISEIAEEVIEYITEQQEEDDEQQEEAPEEADEEEQTTEQLIEASDYKGLKAMVVEYPEFKGIDINIYPAKKIEELRARMFRDLAKKADKKVPEAAAPVKKEEKPAAKKDAAKKDAPAKKTVSKGKVDYSAYRTAKKDKELNPAIETYWKKHLGKKTDKGVAVVVPVCEKYPQWNIDQVYAIFAKCAKSGK